MMHVRILVTLAVLLLTLAMPVPTLARQERTDLIYSIKAPSFAKVGEPFVVSMWLRSRADQSGLLRTYAGWTLLAPGTATALDLGDDWRPFYGRCGATPNYPNQCWVLPTTDDLARGKHRVLRITYTASQPGLVTFRFGAANEVPAASHTVAVQ